MSDPITLPAVVAPSILGGGLKGADMITSAQLPGLMASSTPTLMGGLGSFGGAAIDAVKANPFPAAYLGLGIYDRMNMSQAPLQPSAMQSAQQLIGQPGAVPIPQFNSLLQASHRPIYIG